MSKTICEDCGCAKYGKRCTNCHEELFIADQYQEQSMELPSKESYFMKKVNDLQNRLKDHKKRFIHE